MELVLLLLSPRALYFGGIRYSSSVRDAIVIGLPVSDFYSAHALNSSGVTERRRSYSGASQVGNTVKPLNSCRKGHPVLSPTIVAHLRDGTYLRLDAVAVATSTTGCCCSEEERALVLSSGFFGTSSASGGGGEVATVLGPSISVNDDDEMLSIVRCRTLL